MSDMWARLAGPFREFEGVAGALYVVDRLMRRVSPSFGLRVYELMAQPISPAALLPPARTRDLTYDEMPRGHPDIDRMPARPEIKARRFEQGARCALSRCSSQGRADRIRMVPSGYLRGGRGALHLHAGLAQ